MEWWNGLLWLVDDDDDDDDDDNMLPGKGSICQDPF